MGFLRGFSTLRDEASLFLYEKEFETLKLQHKASQEAYLLGEYAAKKAPSYYEDSALPLTFFFGLMLKSSINRLFVIIKIDFFQTHLG